MIKLSSLFPIVVLFLLITSVPLTAQSHISYLEGSVTVVRNSDSIEGSIGFSLREGDIIQTGFDSLAILEIEGRGTLKMREETLIALDDLGKQTSVSLKSGGLFSKIKKLLGFGYEVNTPTVVAGVRGTEFFMAFGRTVENTPDLWLCVNEGTVEVALGGEGDSVLVDEGEGITIPGGNRLTSPRFYSWTEDLNWNTDPENGEIKDSTNLDSAYADLRNFDYD